MAVDKHPSRSPSPPRKPPCDRQGQGARKSGEDAPYGVKHPFDGYEHSSAHHTRPVYGHQKGLKHHAPHKSEVEGAAGGFGKAGSQKGNGEPG